MQLKENPHAMKSGDIFPIGGKVTVVNGFSSRNKDIVKIWKRCIKRWQVNHDSIPTSFMEMALFIDKIEGH